MFVIITRQRLHQPTYYLIFSLWLSDFIIALFGQSAYTTDAAFKESVSCTENKIISFLHGTSCSASLMLLCMISRDRWLHVAKGLRYDQFMNNKKVILLSVACFFISICLALPFCFEGKYMKFLGIFVFTVIAIACFMAICIMNVNVHRLVKSHFNEMENNRQDNGLVEGARLKQRQERTRVERSVNQSIIAVIMAYSISWFPLLILMLAAVVYKSQNKDTPSSYKTAFVWAVTMAYLNGAINPFINAYRCDNIGRDIRAFVLNIKRKVFPGSHVEPY